MSETTRPAQDIEARLRASDERLRLAETASGVGTFELDLATGRWELSPQTAVLFGLDPQAAPASFADWERVVFFDDVPKLRAAMSEAARTGTYRVEFRVHHPDGSMHWLSGKGTTVQTGAGEAARLHGAYFDITDRKALDVRLLALNETLQAQVADHARQLDETESRFRLLVEAVTDYAIYMLDPEGTVVSWNAGAERIKGYTRDEIIGSHFSRFYTDEDRRRNVPHQALAVAEASGRYEAEGWRVRKGGNPFWASVIINAVRDASGRLVGFAKITRDLTQHKANEERMRQAQKLEAVGQLTGGVAHDFNNLLTVILGNIEAWERHLPENADPILHRLSNSALHGVERAAILIERLLVFSRRQPLDPTAVSANDLISRLSEMLRRTLGETILIETVLATGVWPIFVDTNQLESALLNLAINARDAMPDGGRLTIEAANAYLDEDYAATADVPEGQYVTISVSDTGTGMTPQVAAQAFEPFFTTKEVGQGTGLGLSQVYGFIKQSGGHVKIYSEPGSGTTVKLHLPRYFASGVADESPTDALAVPRGRGETILVTEDDTDVRSFSVEALRDMGYAVLDAVDGATGLRVLDAHREIKLLFTDVGLPGNMNGRQLADEAQRRRPGLKVLFTSGYARNAIVHHGRLDPGVELITKPFSYAALATRVRRLLDGH